MTETVQYSIPEPDNKPACMTVAVPAVVMIGLIAGIIAKIRRANR